MRLNVSFKENDSALNVSFQENDESLKVSFSEAQIVSGEDIEIYDGPYAAFPKFRTQELKTAEKKMRYDVQIFPIMVHSVSNPQGGITVTIGSI